jgi:hypothetical protein
MNVCRFRVLWSLVTVVVLAATTSVPALAQQEPIYAVYDGFVVTDEGLHVLSFAYFSHNFEPVTVPAGPRNRFGTESGDRMQPTLFLPGHHRFQCVMVMGPDFEGGLRWTVDHAGVATPTSADMLQYNWELEIGSVRNVLRDVEPAEAPRGVCLNRSPTVRFLGLRNGPEGAPAEVAATLGSDLKLFGSVRDEGLPRGGVVVTAWRMLAGPGTVTFSASDEPRTLASFDEAGVYELELWTSDGEREGSNRVTVTVSPAP